MPRHWFLKTRHRNVGPITSKQLIRLAAKGKIGPRHGVSSDGKSWIKAREVCGLDFGEPHRSDEGPEGPSAQSSGTEDRTQSPSKKTSGKSSGKEPRIRIQTRRGVAGPFTIEKLQRLIDSGKVRPSSPAQDAHDRGDDDQWIRADEFPQLSFPPAPIQRAKDQPTKGQTANPTQTSVSSGEDTTVESTENEPTKALASKRPNDLAPDAHVVSKLDAETNPASEHQNRLAHRRALKAHFCSPLTVHATGPDRVEVLSFGATERRPFKTLVTNGLLPATESPIELLLYVEDDHQGVIGLIRHLAAMVRHAVCESKATVAVGTVIANGHPAAPIAVRSALDHFLFLPPPIAADQLLREKSNTEKRSSKKRPLVHPAHPTADSASASNPAPLLRRYLWVQPISSGERDVRDSLGLKTLVAALQAEDHRKMSPACVFDPFREPLYAAQPAPDTSRP